MNDLTPLYYGIAIFLGLFGFGVCIDIVTNDGRAFSNILKALRGK